MKLIKFKILILTLFTSFLGLSLIFFRTTDQSIIFDSSNGSHVNSLIFKFFTNSAGLFFYLFGVSSFIFVAFLSLYTVYLFKNYPRKFVDKIIASGLLIPFFACFSYITSLEIYRNIYPGGYVGKSFYGFLSLFLNPNQIFYFVSFSCLLLFIIIDRFFTIKFLFSGMGKIYNLLKSKKIDKPQEEIWDQFKNEPEKEIKQKPDYYIPSDLLKPTFKPANSDVPDNTKELAKIIELKLESFGVQGYVETIIRGPVINLFEYKPADNTKIRSILALENDLALALKALSLRIIAPVPGKSVIGFEVVCDKRDPVLFSDLIASKEYKKFDGQLPLILGKDTLGANIIVDLVNMPHLLVAGATGSGKSVGLNCMLMSLLCTKSPEDLKLILFDPKRLEFSGYENISHLLYSVVTDPTHGIDILKNVVTIMQDRYKLMSEREVKNIAEFRSKFPKEKSQMPFIVIMIDEFADLMMTSSKEVEYLITRLAQMARAAGIYLIVATQRPSVDVITGLIKVNFPSRIAFKVTSKVDSRTIIDTMGAEKLLGKGDMLFLNSAGNISRIHGAYISNEETQVILNYLRQSKNEKLVDTIR